MLKKIIYFPGKLGNGYDPCSCQTLMKGGILTKEKGGRGL